MIIKSFELNKIKINTANLILFYGKNDGEKNQYFKSLKEDKEIYNYEEKEILENSDNFFNNILTRSLFEYV